MHNQPENIILCNPNLDNEHNYSNSKKKTKWDYKNIEDTYQETVDILQNYKKWPFQDAFEHRFYV